MGINSLEVGPPVNMTVFQPWASFKAQTLSTIQVLLLCFCSISCKQLGSFIPLWTKSCAGNSPTQSIGLPLLCRPTRISNSLSWSIDMFSKKKTVGLQWEICKDCTCISFFDLKGNPMLNRIGLPTPHLPSSLVAPAFEVAPAWWMLCPWEPDMSFWRVVFEGKISIFMLL